MEVPGGGSIQLATVLSFVDIATDALAGAREEIDALNVYPVPDGDTGTNITATLSYALESAQVSDSAGETMSSIADAALVGACLLYTSPSPRD